MFYRFCAVFFVLICGFVCCETPETLSAKESPRDVSDRNERAVLNYLDPISKSSEKAIRLYFRAECHTTKDFNANDPVPFPLTKVRQPSKDKTGLAAVREIFKDNKNVTITEDRRAIRIWIGQVPTELLQTKLRRFTLPPLARYNHTVAVQTLRSTNEIESAEHSLGISLVSDIGGLVAEPQKGLPHLPGTMKDVTVDHVLDVIASTFHQVVVYGACTEATTPEGEKFVWID